MINNITSILILIFVINLSSCSSKEERRARNLALRQLEQAALADPENGTCERPTYKGGQNSMFRMACGSGSVYLKDNNVWSVSEYGGHRFGMPKEWVDRELKGAELAAFRLEPSGRKRCHGEGDEEKCVWSFENVLDLWIKNDAGIDIKGGRPLEFKPWKSSLYELGELNPWMKEKWEGSFGLQNVSFLVNGESIPSYRFYVLSYNRQLRKGLTQVTMFIDGRAALLDSRVPRAVKFPKTDGGYHTVHLPAQFWHRVAELHDGAEHIDKPNWLGGRERPMNLWVYGKEFANKYNLPDSKISSELVGAMGIAYRLEPRGVKSCGYGGAIDSCTPSGSGRWKEIFDFYVSPQAEFGSVAGAVFDHKQGSSSFSSTYFMSDQNPDNDFDLSRSHFAINPFKSLQFEWVEIDIKKAKHRSRGGSLHYGSAFMKHSVWNLGFSVVSVLENLPFKYKGLRAHSSSFLFVASQNLNHFDEIETSGLNYHKIDLPPNYMEQILDFCAMHKNKEGTFLDVL